MDQTACCTCATLLSQTPRLASSSTSDEKQRPPPENRLLDCCGRVICGNCIHKNPRFSTYCPYCQTSSSSSSSPGSFTPRSKAQKSKVEEDQEQEQGNEPPPYENTISSTKAAPSVGTEEPPPYTAASTEAEDSDTQLPSYYHHLLGNSDNSNSTHAADRKKTTGSDEEEEEPTLHFLNHPDDTIQSLSLRYSVPAQHLRSFNRLSSDHLLLARQTILIPPRGNKSSSKAKIVSLSPSPVQGEAEQIRKSKIRRWMVVCKVHDYDVAVLYLEQAGYDLDAATEAYFADEAWERVHPVPFPFPNGTASSSSSSRSGSGRSGVASSSSSATNGGKWVKVRAYHQKRLNGQVPSSLLNIRPS